MKSVLEALGRLKGEPDIIRRSALATRLDARKECASLIRTRDVLQARTETIKTLVPVLDPKKIWARFQAAGGDLNELNGLEFKTLCIDTETAVQPRFVQALHAQPERLQRSVCLYSMVNSYFSRWRSMAEPEELERLLQNALSTYPRRSPVVERWIGAKSLFSPQAADRLADFVVTKQSSIANVLKLQYVGPATRLALFAQARTAESASERFRREELVLDESSKLRYLEWMLKDVFTDTLMPGALHSAVSSLILSRSAETSGKVRTVLREFIQRCPRLGDPRLRNAAPNWRDMAPGTEQRYLSWLAVENIQFFFNTILPRNDHNRRRADFWLRYHGRIVDFQVALSDEDLLKLKSMKASADLPLHSRVLNAPTSAFLMKFKGTGTDFVVVEFSETGNAAYIYERAAFESKNVNFRTPAFYVSRHLKHNGHRDRILHLGAWEVAARRKLIDYGIWP